VFEEKFSASTVDASATFGPPSEGGGWAIRAIVDADKWLSYGCSIRTDDTYLFKTNAPQPYVAGQLVKMDFFECHDDKRIYLTFEREAEQ
jgi:hypothetical protein